MATVDDVFATLNGMFALRNKANVELDAAVTFEEWEAAHTKVTEFEAGIRMYLVAWIR